MLSTFLISLNSVLIIITVIIIGFLIGKSRIVSQYFINDVSTIVVNVALPISVFISSQNYITKQNFNTLLIGFILSMISIGLCFLIAIPIGRSLHLQKDRKSLFTNAFVNANTLFVGLPLNIALFGNKSLPYFLAYFVANTITTWGIGVKLIYKDNPESIANYQTTWRRILSLFTPPMWGFIVGIICFFINLKLPVHGFLYQSFSYIANIVTPLSLIFLGLQLARTKMAATKIEKIDLIAQFGKFIMAPLMMSLVLWINQLLGWVNLPDLFIKTLLIQSVTPMLTVLPMLAEQNNMDVEFSTRVLTESIFIFPFAVVIIMLFA
ncbi:AEC family transporter [Weissella paramesenteroides]|uniref:AEC family transporter n=1 Tax=Weissella paramesenteroides TaxID=1249 RepID=UPI00398354BE